MTDQELPHELMVALYAYLDDPSWLPPMGTPGLRAMAKNGGDPTDRDFEWVETQRALQVKANDLYRQMCNVAPPPTAEEIMNGGQVNYPDWIGTPWSETLMSPWAQDLDDAILKAEEYVEQKASTKA